MRVDIVRLDSLKCRKHNFSFMKDVYHRAFCETNFIGLSFTKQEPVVFPLNKF
jgi:hypothetical protein